MNPPEASEIVAAIAAFVAAVNQGDQAAATALLTDDVTIVEDLAPFCWHGPTAASEWMLAMFVNAQSAGLTGVVMELGEPTRVEVDSAHAYAIFGGRLVCSGTGPPLRSTGNLTFALAKDGARRLIRAFSRSGPPPA